MLACRKLPASYLIMTLAFARRDEKAGYRTLLIFLMERSGWVLGEAWLSGYDERGMIVYPVKASMVR